VCFSPDFHIFSCFLNQLKITIFQLISLNIEKAFRTVIVPMRRSPLSLQWSDLLRSIVPSKELHPTLLTLVTQPAANVHLIKTLKIK